MPDAPAPRAPEATRRTRLLTAHPFLAELPAGLLRDLDTSELHLPDEVLRDQVAALSARVGHHLMTYRRTPSGWSASGPMLCALVEPARLSADQVALLRDAEEHAGVVLVAYRRPLTLRS